MFRWGKPSKTDFKEVTRNIWRFFSTRGCLDPSSLLSQPWTVPAGSVWPRGSTSDGQVSAGRPRVSFPSFDMMPVTTARLFLNSLIPVAFSPWFCLSLGSFSTPSSSLGPFCHRVEMRNETLLVSGLTLPHPHSVPAIIGSSVSFWGFKRV